MTSWPDTRIQQLLGVELPILQAPMAGAAFEDMAIAVSQAGGLGALACAMLSPAQIEAAVGRFRAATDKPLNLNFFCHQPPVDDPAREAGWRQRLSPYFTEFDIDPQAVAPAPSRAPFDEATCALVEKLRPEVVSFHFGLPEPALLARVKAAGARVLSSATTVEEARWLEAAGCDAIIAQGAEAGGHRGMFLNDHVYAQVGTFALVPQVADAVRVPVIAAGGVADGRGIAAAFVLGASAVQVGTAYLLCPEARISAPHRAALMETRAQETALTNIFSGRPARGIVNRVMRELGPLSPVAPAFPLAGGALAPLRAKTEPTGSGDFMSLWSGQAASLVRPMPAGDLTRQLAADALARMAGGQH